VTNIVPIKIRRTRRGNLHGTGPHQLPRGIKRHHNNNADAHRERPPTPQPRQDWREALQQIRERLDGDRP